MMTIPLKANADCIKGISFKTQLLYAIVFMTRYLDLAVHYYSLYNTCMKIFFIVSSVYILYLMKVKFRASYDTSLDTFRFEFLVLFAVVLGLATAYKYTPLEVRRLGVSHPRLLHTTENAAMFSSRYSGRFQSG